MSNSLSLGRWSSLRGAGHFSTRGPTFVGVSGGSTSAMLAALLPDDAVLTFQNTGRELPRTLDFLDELDAALGRRIVWLEFRKPRVKGAAPKNFEYAVVNYRTADRSGRPFEELLEALAEYRATLCPAKGPLAPWARGRFCTAYLKHRVMDHYVRDVLGETEAHDSVVGLRADEERRVVSLRKASTQRVSFRVPLYEAGITKADVREFWAAQSFALGLQDHEGNCGLCFLKDQADQSRMMLHPDSDPDWWIAMQAKWALFGGRDHVGYAALRDEAPVRIAIADALRRGVDPQALRGPSSAERRQLPMPAASGIEPAPPPCSRRARRSLRASVPARAASGGRALQGWSARLFVFVRGRDGARRRGRRHGGASRWMGAATPLERGAP